MWRLLCRGPNAFCTIRCLIKPLVHADSSTFCGDTLGTRAVPQSTFGKGGAGQGGIVLDPTCTSEQSRCALPLGRCRRRSPSPCLVSHTSAPVRALNTGGSGGGGGVTPAGLGRGGGCNTLPRVARPISIVHKHVPSNGVPRSAPCVSGTTQRHRPPACAWGPLAPRGRDSVGPGAARSRAEAVGASGASGRHRPIVHAVTTALPHRVMRGRQCLGPHTQGRSRTADNRRRRTLPPPKPKGQSWDKTRFTIGKIWSGHFWYTNIWVPGPPPPPPPLFSCILLHTPLAQPLPDCTARATQSGGAAGARGFCISSRPRGAQDNHNA